ncbi:putative multi-domain containing protein [Aduncisulcus paluster]|uniref:Multi-domain containing protein n=1 Tax=Aduncisulcus paluster TaxID=2918883 RepID=A0ABQ5KVN2_9EUKA|nr:putative multi-domain containing protein [Aduncisulcus paluster]
MAIEKKQYSKSKTDSEPKPKQTRFRITLTSPNLKRLEKSCSELINNAERNRVQKRGPVRLPTKHLKITTRKTPCGQGSKTWDHFELRIHKRLVDITCSLAQARKITKIGMHPGVDVEVTVPRK